MEWIELFMMFLCTLGVSISVNFLNRDDKRLPWRNVLIFVAISMTPFVVISILSA
ncbi:hypothetical protein ACFOU0_08660 [Salinicoccus sesuvii]|uniref:Uncharacterized protein n=1 Tax=Salinicoccus sesuvii TaxID=868281 RepID=A0ABV7N7W8_9STAP